jgi:hypothetical protein
MDKDITGELNLLTIMNSNLATTVQSPTDNRRTIKFIRLMSILLEITLPSTTQMTILLKKSNQSTQIIVFAATQTTKL